MEMLPRYGLVDTARLFIKLRERIHGHVSQSAGPLRTLMQPKAMPGSEAERTLRTLGRCICHLQGTGDNPHPEQKRAPALTMNIMYGDTQQHLQVERPKQVPLF